MATEIERLIAQLQKETQELARRDHEHDEHITILLGQVVTLLPEVRELKAQVSELDGRLTTRLGNIETAITLLSGNITNMRTELLVIKALVAKEEE